MKPKKSNFALYLGVFGWLFITVSSSTPFTIHSLVLWAGFVFILFLSISITILEKLVDEYEEVLFPQKEVEDE